VDALNDLIDGFKMDQGWNNDTVLDLLKRFLWDRQDKWLNRSMLSDIDSTFKEVASLENQDE
jgi:hypothetical protein